MKPVIVLLFLVMTASAQRGPVPRGTTPQPPPTRGSRTGNARSSTMQVEIPSPIAEVPVPFGVPSADGTGALQPLGSVSPELNFEHQVVTGIPFSAETVTEHVQSLTDGNRLVRRSSANVYRDGRGRTRRDHMEEQRGGSSSSGATSSPVVSVINDPVAYTNIVLDHRTSSARRIKLPPALFKRAQADMGSANIGEPRFGVLVPRSARRRIGTPDDPLVNNPPERRTEKLEARNIEGVLAEGTRTTLVIPAGEFDNEKPLEITQERWYSPELHTVVLMRHNDPRFGETTFRLTNVNRGEPDTELFKIPSNYTVKEGVSGVAPGMRPRLQLPQN
ncbi:MAG TPA: hypothetical protein VF708_05170 [Pyrinomonadaceae bacterium]